MTRTQLRRLLIWRSFGAALLFYGLLLALFGMADFISR